MLPSFEVENFRTFSHLQIPHLGGVNLIVGRNNVGKTMLLEALRLYAAEGDINAILGLLYDRDELLSSPTPNLSNVVLRYGFGRCSTAAFFLTQAHPRLPCKPTLKMSTAFK